MPQDKRRSISYRSFVTCDDPKGVVECGAIRKNKIISPQKRQENIKLFEVEKRKIDQNPSLAIIKEEKKGMSKGGITRELDTPASFQLLQVSKGANKLNHVINSWSKSNAKDEQKEIARDLLKGALDLQESLAVLRKLQESSSCSMRKHKQKLENEGRFDGMVKGIMDERLYDYVEFERPGRVSVDGLSRKSFDEMRKVVRDSLLRQNVITNPIFEEHFDYRKFGSPDLASTSTSQSSMIHSSNFVPSNSSKSSPTSQRKNGKGSNLIVRLMGLEPLPSSPRKHKEAEKIVNMAKPVYDLDSPRARKPQFGAPETGARQRSVDEILETLNFKGLLRSNSVNGLMPDSPPIVLIKPITLSFPEREQQSMPNVRDDYASSRIKETLMKLRSRRASEKWKEKEGEADFEVTSKSIKKVATSEVKYSVNPHQKLQKKQAVVKKASDVVEEKKAAKSRSKVEEKKAVTSSQVMRSRDQAKSTTSKVKKKAGSQKLISKSQTSSEQKTTSTATLNRRTWETTEGSSHRVKTRQLSLTGRSQRHKDERKERVATFKEEIDLTSENDPVLPTADSIIVDHFDLEKQGEASQIQITDYDDQSSISDTREVVAYHQNDENTTVCDFKLIRTYEDNNRQRLYLDDNKCSASDITSASITEVYNEGRFNENHIPIPEVTLVTTHENGIAVHPKVCQSSVSDNTLSSTQLEDQIDSSTEPDNETWTKCFNPRMKLKALLLSSSSFVSRAEELFGLQVNISLVSCATEPDLASNKLLLDCANEVMEFRSIQFSQAYLPLPRMRAISNPRTLSSDQLLDEICDEVEELRCYLRLADDDNFSSDNLYILQDRDLKFKSGTWEMGWRNMFSQEDIEKVIGDIDKLVLGKLVEEVLADLCYS